MLRFLIFGDVFGKLGRKALAATLPGLKKKYRPNLVIANVENAAHGAGVTPSTLQEIRDAGVEVFTSGNHIFDNPSVQEIFKDAAVPLLRPYNYSNANPGKGIVLIPCAGKQTLIANIQGRVFMKDLVENPFIALDEILKSDIAQKADAILIDAHTEATSEQTALGWFVNGRASALWGTHTHVPTADARILPGGTAYITDVGMTGSKDSVIGLEPGECIAAYLKGRAPRADVIEEGVAQINAIFVAIDNKTKKAVQLEQIRLEIGVSHAENADIAP